jgi:pimeloyl-ACP methyl ester carboxylesterase
VELVDVGGLRIAYERAGSGPPLVLLHGYVSDGATTWRHQLDALSDRFTVVAWDAPGAGGSSDPPDRFGLDAYADCLAGFIAALRLERACVGGLSFGAIVALALQRRHAACCRALILASGYAGWAGSLPAEVAAARLRQALALSEQTPQAFADALLPTMFSATVPPEVGGAFAASVRRFHPAGFRAMARAASEDVRDVLARIGVPTLVVHGELDVRAPRAVAEGLREAIPGARLVVLPGVGHVCNVEAPAAFTRAVREFLTLSAP